MSRLKIIFDTVKLTILLRESETGITIIVVACFTEVNRPR